MTLPTDHSPAAVHLEPAGRTAQGWRRFVWNGENLLISVALGLMLILPLVEIVLRFWRKGISGSSFFEQHLTLIVGMLGGAIAAREQRLLSLSTLSAFLKGRWKTAAAVGSTALAVAVTFFLCVAAFKFVAIEKETAKIVAYNIPTWALQLVLPLGFAAIALRLLWHGSPSWPARIVTLVLAAALAGLAAKPFTSPDHLVTVALALLLIATVLGAPVFITLGGAALILFWGQDTPIASVAVEHYKQVINPTLPTIPLFTLAGYFLAEGGASRRLVHVFQACVGQFRGGAAIVTALVCAFFTSFTGASGVTILALGGLLMPVLLAARYSERSALGLLTGAGSLGLLFPPCLPMILYAIIAKTVTMEEMFLGGLLPGILLVVRTAAWGVWQSPKSAATASRFDAREAGRAIWKAKWELLLPVIALAALFSGKATPVEAAAVTALYAFIVEVVIYRDLKLTKDTTRVMTECGLLVGGVLLILGVAMGFTNYLIYEEVPTKAVTWVTSVIASKWVFLLALNVFLLIVGCLMDIFSAIVVVVPLLIPLGAEFGIDPIHLGIIFMANLQLGYLTPPVGMNLFLSSYRFSKPMSEVVRSVIPMLLVLLIGVLVITYIPWLTTWLPGLRRP